MTRDDITGMNLHRQWITHVVRRHQGATMPFCVSCGRPDPRHELRLFC